MEDRAAKAEHERTSTGASYRSIARKFGYGSASECKTAIQAVRAARKAEKHGIESVVGVMLDPAKTVESEDVTDDRFEAATTDSTDMGESGDPDVVGDDRSDQDETDDDRIAQNETDSLRTVESEDATEDRFEQDSTDSADLPDVDAPDAVDDDRLGEAPTGLIELPSAVESEGVTNHRPDPDLTDSMGSTDLEDPDVVVDDRPALDQTESESRHEIGRPLRNDPKDDWVDYAVVNGMKREDADAMSKIALVQRFG